MRRFKRFLRTAGEFFHLLFTHYMGLFGTIILVIMISGAVFAPFLGTIDPQMSGDFENVLVSPNANNWFGTDDLARDVYSQLLYGTRISLMIGLVAASIAVSIGAFVGLIAGFYGGRIDNVLMKIVDFVMTLPHLPLLITLAAIIGPSVWNVVFVVGGIYWPGIARVVRSQVLSIKERPFIEASRCIGGSNAYLMFGEILPNVVPIMFAEAVLMITEAIYAEAVLSFLGLGDPTTISWGSMLHFAFESGVMSSALWWVLPPIMAIITLIVAFSLLGTAITDVMKPGYKEMRGF
ncbi:MAG: ABC transporter permease [Desulfobacterales bacterium]|nr:ABC transporter permease [Desulfobacterales bacterium]